MKYGFIGLGNMSTAIIKGLCKSNHYEASSIFGVNRTIEKTFTLADELGIQSCTTIEELVNTVDVIIIGVKPQNLDEVLVQINNFKRDDQLIISIAAGKPLSYYQERLQGSSTIFRVMPNINAIAGASTSCYSTTTEDTAKKAIVEKLFSAVGTIVELQESQFATFTSIACASPAFSYMYIDALARAAVQEGMPKEQALMIAASSVLGSAKMILESKQHPYALIDQVCSPGGTTIEGVMSLQQNGFEHAVHKAIKAVSEKDVFLNKE